jgi:peroxiredoxin Q/BCP
MIEAGEQAPDFTLPDQDGNDVALSGLKGQTVVLYFYPKGNTSGVICSNSRSRSSPGHRHRPRLSGQRPRRRVLRLAR